MNAEAIFQGEGYKIPVRAVMCRKKPFYEPLAQELLAEIRECMQNPEYMAEFQAWKEERERRGKNGAAVDG
ncbi:MAG: hypothetical protein IKN04_20455 [Clostridia bacterium]|nr:hypothetical protein [Clostridia bacterium]